MTNLWYDVNDNSPDCLANTDPCEAVRDYVSNWHEPIQGPVPKTVSVQAYSRMAIQHQHLEGRLDLLLEDLEEDYLGENDYVPSAECVKLYEQFCAKLREEYPVWNCEPHGDAFEVETADYED